MSFAAGVLVGGVVGLGAGLLLGRSRPGSARSRVTPVSPGIVVGVLALVVAGAALIRSGHQDHAPAPAPSTSTTVSGTALETVPTPTVSAPAGTSGQPSFGSAPTATTGAGETVSVPNVVKLSSADAVARIQAAGLSAAVTKLALPNVPPGFVITQNPQPASVVAAGSAVTLVVSTAT